MRYLTRVLMCCGIVLAACGQQSDIEGAWQLVSVAVTDGKETTVIEEPGLGMLMLMDGEYSQVWMQTGRMYSNPPSTLEKVDAYDTFDASAGTYTLEGGVLTLTPRIAHDPNTVGQPTTTTVEITANTLRRTAERPDRDDPSQTIQWTSTYTRLR